MILSGSLYDVILYGIDSFCDAVRLRLTRQGIILMTLIFLEIRLGLSGTYLQFPR